MGFEQIQKTIHVILYDNDNITNIFLNYPNRLII